MTNTHDELLLGKSALRVTPDDIFTARLNFIDAQLQVLIIKANLHSDALVELLKESLLRLQR